MSHSRLGGVHWIRRPFHQGRCAYSSWRARLCRAAADPKSAWRAHLSPLSHLEENGVRSILGEVGSDTDEHLECEVRELVTCIRL